MKTLEALLQLLPLDHLPRTGWVLRGVPQPESIAGHILGACHLALALGPRVEPTLAMERVLGQLLVHDAPEACTGDIPRPAARHLPDGAKDSMEQMIAEELLEPLGSQSVEAWNEFQAGETREARFAKVCDRLQMGVQLVALRRRGQMGLEDFQSGLEALDCEEFSPAEALRRDILKSITRP